jgi:hypothetical protein
LQLLERDARQRGYHGFIRLESGLPGEESLTLTIREPKAINPSPDIELISTADFEPYSVRFERGPVPDDGPLSIGDDLPVAPFELTLRIPRGWSDALYHDAAQVILTRFIRRYRALQAYGQHL